MLRCEDLLESVEMVKNKISEHRSTFICSYNINTRSIDCAVALSGLVQWAPTLIHVWTRL